MGACLKKEVNMKFCILLFINLSFQTPNRNKRDEVGTTEQATMTWNPITDEWFSTATTVATTTSVPEHCPVDWHGQRFAKISFQSKETYVVRVNVKNDEYSSLGEYLGFLIFPRFNCGNDFLDLLQNNTITSTIVDMNDLYTVEHKFKKNAGKDTSLTVQFHRSDPGNRKELAFKNRDQFYLILNGMDKIEWGTKDPVKCIERMFVGNGPPPQKRGQNLSKCVGLGKRVIW